VCPVGGGRAGVGRKASKACKYIGLSDLALGSSHSFEGIYLVYASGISLLSSSLPKVRTVYDPYTYTYMSIILITLGVKTLETLTFVT
jgi:hypothetical protein